MASLNNFVAPRSAAYGLPAPKAPSNAPPGTFLPGTKVQVGNQRVIIEKYLSEGGFAHVYVVRVPGNGDKTEAAVLKRVAVPDKEALASMRTEVDTMKKLKGHKHIVSYIDSHASQLKGGGYEVFLLMEYCAGGGLIDFMNTRLQHRLTEPEIVKIFSDIAEGVACMHYLKPPLLHRDLKVENILIAKSGSSTLYKLCDFGSTAAPRPAARTAAEGLLIEDDVQKHTTLQYRSPEMVDVYRKQPIDEKSDIWALGVLLYKLCYYTTPFEERGQMAILTASFKYPAYPPFSNKIKLLIASMLREDPKERPNIYQVVKTCCAMRGVEVPIKDIYANRSRSAAGGNKQMPLSEPAVASPPTLGAYRSPPEEAKESIPEVMPMRRGRPSAPAPQQNGSKPGISPSRGVVGDPFAALESTSAPVRNAAVDELAERFPSLDDFSLLHDRSIKFHFSQRALGGQMPKTDNLRQRVTNALADNAFAQPIAQKSEPVSRARTPPAHARAASLVKDRSDVGPPTSGRASPSRRHITDERPAMVSVGTMTSPLPPADQKQVPDVSMRPIWRAPPGHRHRSSSQPRASIHAPAVASPPNDVPHKAHSGHLQVHQPKHRAASEGLNDLIGPTNPSSKDHKLSILEPDNSVHRSKSANTQRHRPSSEFIGSNLDFLRDREHPKKTRSPGHSPALRGESCRSSQQQIEEPAIASDIDFLRAMEGNNSSHRGLLRNRSDGAKHNKRASLPSLGFSGSKSVLAKFGDATKRFETSAAGPRARTPSPPGFGKDTQPRGLSPVSASDMADTEEAVVEETEELSPEVRREIERRTLAEEERRVEAMAAEHKRRVADTGGESGGGLPSKASTIQSRVRSLLDESGRAGPIKTAEGYGRYTHIQDKLPSTEAPDETYVKLAGSQQQQQVRAAKSAQLQQPSSMTARPPQTASPVPRPPSTRPAAPPKPKALRTGGQIDVQNPSAQLRALIDADARSDPKPEQGMASQSRATEGLAANGFADVDHEDVLASFSKRYPSVPGIIIDETGW